MACPTVRRSGVGTALACLTTTLSWPARAQDAREQVPIDVVVRGSAKDKETFERTSAVTKVDKEDLSNAPSGSIPDALRRLPGVAVQQTTPGQGTVYVRGMSSREVLILVDGVRLNGALYRAGNNPYLGLVDPYAISAAQIHAFRWLGETMEEQRSGRCARHDLVASVGRGDRAT